MSLINLEEKKIYFSGTVFNPCFDKLVLFNPENNELTLKPSFGENKTMRFRLDVDKLQSFDPELDTKEKLIMYLYSIGMHRNLENIPTSLENALGNIDKLYSVLLGTLKGINDGCYEIITKVIEPDEDERLYDGDSHTVKNLSGQTYIDELSTDIDFDTICQDVLITSKGQPNWDYIRKLKTEGFEVFATEKDSFGWLGAAVRTNKGLIFFG